MDPDLSIFDSPTDPGFGRDVLKPRHDLDAAYLKSVRALGETKVIEVLGRVNGRGPGLSPADLSMALSWELIQVSEPAARTLCEGEASDLSNITEADIDAFVDEVMNFGRVMGNTGDVDRRAILNLVNGCECKKDCCTSAVDLIWLNPEGTLEKFTERDDVKGVVVALDMVPSFDEAAKARARSELKNLISRCVNQWKMGKSQSVTINFLMQRV